MTDLDPYLPQQVDGAACSPATASPQGTVTSGPRPAALKPETGSRLAGEPQRPEEAYAERPNASDVETRHPWRDLADRLLGPVDRPWWRPRWWR